MARKTAKPREGYLTKSQRRRRGRLKERIRARIDAARFARFH
jgi:hypothetical protein